MAAQQRDSCKNEFGAENQRDEQLFICPHLSLSSPALGLSWLALQEGKLTFEHHCYCPVEEIKMHIHGLAFGLFLMASSRKVTLFSALSGRMHHRGSFESEWGKKLKQHPVGNPAQGQKPQGWRGFHILGMMGWDIIKRGKGRCRSVEQTLSCGRKATGSSGLRGELQEQNNSCFPHSHKHPWPSSGRLDDPICSENEIH